MHLVYAQAGGGNVTKAAARPVGGACQPCRGQSLQIVATSLLSPPLPNLVQRDKLTRLNWHEHDMIGYGV